jgi:hypothetical protein
VRRNGETVLAANLPDALFHMEASKYKSKHFQLWKLTHTSVVKQLLVHLYFTFTAAGK